MVRLVCVRARGVDDRLVFGAGMNPNRICQKVRHFFCDTPGSCEALRYNIVAGIHKPILLVHCYLIRYSLETTR